ncbi:hypothetical protein [Methanoculleus chikugoensis]|uniref:hypothetical protein n=1 Tax=Methanoculleus chikugoensis TaxID=118126 RepID=UPI000A7F5E32|nr:hypothetical protein [Methanoculleus chikugoensis]
MHRTPDSVLKPQKYLGGDAALSSLLRCSPPSSRSRPISTSLLPGMGGDYFGVSASQTNLTLILFFIFFSLGLLFWGGRSPTSTAAGPSCLRGLPCISPQASDALYPGMYGT